MGQVAKHPIDQMNDPIANCDVSFYHLALGTIIADVHCKDKPDQL